MSAYRVVVTSLSITGLVVLATAERLFPAGFKFGAATAAYQVEGGWNTSDKGESNWDRFVHTNPGAIRDRSNGDMACDSYHLWEEDVRIVTDLNLDHYRFSISWSRVLPTGLANHVSDDGAKYYEDLIDSLLKNGVEPVVTLYHWDLPQRLQDMGGWTNPLIVDWFADYARVVFDLYGDRVKTWITINEPVTICDITYAGIFPPGGIYSEDRGAYVCSKNVLLAHATAYRLYEKEYKPKYNGQVSFCNHLFWFEPESQEDTELTELAKDMMIGRFSYPVFSASGGWPPALEQFIANKSSDEGNPRSKLPAFTQDEIDLLRGSADFYAVNHYTTKTVRATAAGEDSGVNLLQGSEELGASFGSSSEWNATTSSWFKVHPEGFRELLVYLHQQYGGPRVWITENGLADTGDTLDDQARVDFFKEYLAQVLLAMGDGVNVVGYTAWSLMDNFEWLDGYQSRFGLHHVNFSSPLRARTPRRSARYYAQLARTRDIDASYEFVDPEEETPDNASVGVINCVLLVFCVLISM